MWLLVYQAKYIFALAISELSHGSLSEYDSYLRRVSYFADIVVA